MKKLIAVLVFIIIEVVLLPITMFGGVWFVLKLFVTTQRGGESNTAYQPTLVRWMMHKMGSRQDYKCEKMLMSLPAASHFALKMMFGPTLLAMRLSGFKLKMVTYPAVRPSTVMSFVAHRTDFFDNALLDYLEKIQQLVILGAGWDTRAYNLPDAVDVKVFEVDTVKTQKVKQEALLQAGIETAHVTFVAADFNKASWLDRLRQQGFDSNLPTFFLLEGVVYYLETDGVYATFDTVSSQCINGSAIAFDYYSRGMVKGKGSLAPTNLAIKYLLKAAGEQWQFGIPTDPPARKHIDILLEAHGLKLEKYEPYGSESDDEKASGGLVVAVLSS